ncbi:MAG: urate hydroxylase PuuD [Pseudomonadales bacterium]
MGDFISMDLLFRIAHVLFGVTWIGMLYYFNFVQTEYFKEAEADAKADAIKKLAPRALWWFRWGAMFTFITGVVLLIGIRQSNGIDGYILMGALAGTFMFLNVWLVIWPKQQIVLGLKEGDGPSSAAKAGLASRTNTLLSIPMLLGMMGSPHGAGNAGSVLDHSNSLVTSSPSLGIWLALIIVVAVEANGLFGKTGPITTIRGVIHSSIALAVVLLAVMQLV